ncbi:MAG: hypothetical protein NDI60_01720 [Elusimicrobiales bacterium]|nr:hypothetical protein [Elusimicrobiales bacterium]
MRKTIGVLILLGLALPALAADKPVYKWNAANELYVLLPTPQNLYLKSSRATEIVHPLGLGLRAVGNGELFGRTGGLQVQLVKTAHNGSFWLLDFLAGVEYVTPKTEGRPLRFTVAALGDLGLADTNFYLAPILSAGLIYTTDQAADTPVGLTLNLFWRPSGIDIPDAGGGRDATLKPVLGVKLGYIFEGFWSVK